MTRREKTILLERSMVFERLSAKSLLKLMWWEISRSPKIDVFYKCLQDGMSAFAAFKTSSNTL
jgi:hypothetical protein